MKELKSLFLPLAACFVFISACSESEPEEETASAAVTIHKISESDPGGAMHRPLVDDAACNNIDDNYVVINVHTPEVLHRISTVDNGFKRCYYRMAELYKIERLENMHYGRKDADNEWRAYSDGEMESLRDDIQRDLKARPGAKLMLRTDINTCFERVYSLMKIANEQGISHIDFSVLPLVNGGWSESHVEKVVNYEIPSPEAYGSSRHIVLNITENSELVLHQRGKKLLLSEPLGDFHSVFFCENSLSERNLPQLVEFLTSVYENELSKVFVMLEVHPRAHMQRFIDVLSALKRTGVIHIAIKISSTAAPSLDMPAMKPLVNQNSPVSINAPVSMVSDIGEGLSPCLDIGDSFGSGDLDGDFGDTLGGTVGGGSTLEGTFYDLKKLKNGKKSELKGGPENRNAVIEELSKFFANWDRAVIDKYYQGEHRLYASSWYLPAASADYGPIAFGVGDPKEKDKTKWECEPSAWLSVYRGKVIAPKTGKFRFIGTGDDFLAVRFNGKTVLEAGYFAPTFFDKENLKKSCISAPAQREAFLEAHNGYEMITSIRGCEMWNRELGGLVAGATFSVKEGDEYNIEIAVADITGDTAGFVLFIDDVTNGKNSNAKQYDLFRTCDANPDIDKVLQALKDADCYIGDNRIPFNEDSWVWEVVPED